MPFEHSLTVRFHEIDRAGIVYFSRVYEYCHVTYEEMMTRALGTDLETYFRDSPWVAPLVHSEADFEHPMRIGDRLTISLAVKAVGRRSVTYDYIIRAGDQVTATALLKHVCVDRTTFEPVPVPTALLEGLKRLDLHGGD